MILVREELTEKKLNVYYGLDSKENLIHWISPSSEINRYGHLHTTVENMELITLMILLEDRGCELMAWENTHITFRKVTSNTGFFRESLIILWELPANSFIDTYPMGNFSKNEFFIGDLFFFGEK